MHSGYGRIVAIAAALGLSACASNGLQSVPSSSIDLSGRWKLNVADSDDPQHLSQAARQASSAAGAASHGGGRGGGQHAAQQNVGVPSFAPPTPSVGVMGASLRWPGKDLEITQLAANITFSSEGKTQICRPGAKVKKPSHQDSDRDMPAGREAPPPSCGWLEKTLVIRNGTDPDDDRPPLEERYTLIENGQRLVEEVGFRGGRSNGFTMSRVWDRVPPTP